MTEKKIIFLSQQDVEDLVKKFVRDTSEIDETKPIHVKFLPIGIEATVTVYDDSEKKISV